MNITDMLLICFHRTVPLIHPDGSCIIGYNEKYGECLRGCHLDIFGLILVALVVIITLVIVKYKSGKKL